MVGPSSMEGLRCLSKRLGRLWRPDLTDFSDLIGCSPGWSRASRRSPPSGHGAKASSILISRRSMPLPSASRPELPKRAAAVSLECFRFCASIKLVLVFRFTPATMFSMSSVPFSRFTSFKLKLKVLWNFWSSAKIPHPPAAELVLPAPRNASSAVNDFAASAVGSSAYLA